MASTRVICIVGETLVEDSREALTSSLIDGLSTVPLEAIQVIHEKLSELPHSSEKSTQDGASLLQRKSKDLSVSLLFRPSATALTTVLKNTLSPPSKPDEAVNVIVIYSGLVSEGSGFWLLPDFVCTPTFFEDIVNAVVLAYPKPIDIENQPPFKRILLHIAIGGTTSGGEWKQLLTRRFDTLSGHNLVLSVNSNHPPGKHKPSAAGDSAESTLDLTDLNNFFLSILEETSGQFCPLLSTKLTSRGSNDPTLRVVRPCLYVFPEGSGQSAIFAVPGYNMLINTGCSHRPSFWPVANYLDRVDSVFITHWGIDNLLGMRTVLPVAFATNPSLSESQQPLLCLVTPPPNLTNPFHFPDPPATKSPLSVSLPRQLGQLVTELKQSGTRLTVYSVTRGAKLTSTAQCIQLYKKIGQGTLELYPLTPTDEDTAELRKLNDDWVKASPALMTTAVSLGKTAPGNKYSVPLLSHMSVSGLLLWRPSRDTDAVLRILFVAPIAHQARVLVSLEAIVAANICLRHSNSIPAELERKRPVTAPPRRPTVQTVRTTKTPSVGSISSAELKSASKPATVANKKSSTPQTKQAVRSPMVVKSAEAVKKPNAQSKHTPEVLSSPALSKPEAPLLQANGDANGYNLLEHQNLATAMNNVALDDAQPTEIPPSDSAATIDHTEPPILDDPVALWGTPQGLPAPVPPIGPTHNGKGPADKPVGPTRRITSAGTARPTSAVVGRNARPNGTTAAVAGPTFAPGCTDASAHAIGPNGAKMSPYDKLKPIYVDISFLPGGGSTHLVDVEWFKRVRARYYVATDPEPSVALMEAIVIGKESWTGEDAKLPVSVVFAYETEDLLVWLGRNAARLNACHIDVAAVMCRSSIQLMSGEGSSTEPLTCTGYRIDL